MRDIIDTVTVAGQPLTASLDRPVGDYQAVILYYHGGGLIYGQRDDLPAVYVQMLTEAGIGVVSFDYPLAPESKASQIQQAIQAQTDWFFASGREALGIGADVPVYIMGRSAGAFIAIHEAYRRPTDFAGLISFYGYYNLNDASFTVPSRHYLQYPEVTKGMVQSLLHDGPLTEGLMERRYPIYLYARQQGAWHEILLDSHESAKDYSLVPAQLKTLPRTFITSSTQDPDVPVRQSRFLAKHVPESVLHIVESAEHDFDRTEVERHGIPVYQALIDWIHSHHQ